MKSLASDRIEINRNKIYRANDLEEFAKIFFPQKTARQLRAAFMAIFCEIKNARERKIQSTDHIAEQYQLSPSSITKARTKLVRIGLITKREGSWQFSGIFAGTLKSLIEKLESFKTPALSRDQEKKERMFIEIAKGVGVVLDKTF